MEFLLIAICIGTIPGFIAQSKGRSFLAWWLYGAALFIVALPHSLLIKADVKQIEREQLQSGDARKCPFCAEIIKAEAIVCRYCGRDVPALERPSNLRCPKCKTPVQADTKRCPGCGGLFKAGVEAGLAEDLPAEEHVAGFTKDWTPGERRFFRWFVSILAICAIGALIVALQH